MLVEHIDLTEDLERALEIAGGMTLSAFQWAARRKAIEEGWDPDIGMTDQITTRHPLYSTFLYTHVTAAAWKEIEFSCFLKYAHETRAK